MQIILFSQNTHKVNEIKDIFSGINVKLYCDMIEPFDVIENGNSFQENALLKVRGLLDKISDKLPKDSILMAEDSGICIEALNGKPGIFSARFANINDIHLIKNTSDEANIDCVINELQKLHLKSSNAYFVSCVAVFTNGRFFSTHGFLNGRVICQKRGNKGFGYDPIFIPNGFMQTLGEIPSDIKNTISHRFRALKLMKLLLQ